MKQNKFRFLSLALVGLMMVAAISCQEKFTEEDALKAQQQIGLAIYVVDYSTTEHAAVANAKVVVSQGGNTMEATTDDKGVAQFSTIAIGEYVYTVSADSYTTVSGLGSVNPDNFRQGQVTDLVGLYSLNSDRLVTVKGNVTFEKDVTNTAKEFPAVKVYVDVYLNSGTKTFVGTTDASGNYSVKVPVDGDNGNTYMEFRFPDFEANQSIAVNRFSDEEAFPKTNPRVESMNTLFSMNTNFVQNYSFSTDGVRSVFATVEAPPATGTQAVVDWVYTNSLGEVTSVSFSNGGNYTGDADGKVKITINSIDGGSGASIDVTLNGNSSVSTAYATPANVVITKGSGYPKSSDNYTLNKIGYRFPSYRSYAYAYPGDVVIANADYGTGVYRTKAVNTSF